MARILIAEDNQSILMSLALRLKKEGHEVLPAQDAATAVMAAVKEQPDLLILDISMPCGNGFTVAERVQTNTRTLGTPIIFITASKKPELREKAKELGAFGFFEKPYDSQELLKAVESALLGEPAPQN